MKTRSKPVSVRLTIENFEWLRVKASGKRGRLAELVELAVTEMRQNMEATGDVERKTPEQMTDEYNQIGHEAFIKVAGWQKEAQSE